MAAAEKKMDGLLAFPVKAIAKKTGLAGEAGPGTDDGDADAAPSKELKLAQNVIDAIRDDDSEGAARNLVAVVKSCIASYGE